jgi:hypothetical protein
VGKQGFAFERGRAFAFKFSRIREATRYRLAFPHQMACFHTFAYAESHKLPAKRNNIQAVLTIKFFEECTGQLNEDEEIVSELIVACCDTA